MNSPSRTVELWLDFVSAYSWLAVARAPALERRLNCRFRVRPFAIGPLLEQIDRKGIAQVPVSRRYAVFDVAREAAALGLRFVGPPRHPFVSLKALRTQMLVGDDPQALELAGALFRAAWEAGADLTDTDTLLGICQEVAPAALASALAGGSETFTAAIQTREVKDALRANTDEAVARGIFGAPFFFLDGEPFYGQDRMPQLSARLAGTTPKLDDETMEHVQASIDAQGGNA